MVENFNQRAQQGYRRMDGKMAIRQAVKTGLAILLVGGVASLPSTTAPTARAHDLAKVFRPGNWRDSARFWQAVRLVEERLMQARG
jgi:hypothetical protein